MYQRDNRAAFESVLSAALTDGQAASMTVGLGPATRRAIDVIAEEHPEANAHQIVSAYDAYMQEHDRSMRGF